MSAAWTWGQEMTQPDTYSDEEAARRRDEALRRALNTPPPIKPIAKPKRIKPKLDQTQTGETG